MIKNFCRIGALAAAVALTPVAGHAQSLVEFSFGGGPSIPVGQLGDEAKMGGHAAVALGIKPAVSPVQIRARLQFQTFYAENRENSIFRTVGGEWYRQLSWMADLVYGKQVGNFRPYALVGGGWIHEWHDDRTYYADSHMTLNLNVGAGVDFPLYRSTSGFVEARYLNVAGGEALSTRAPAVLPEVQFKSIPVTVGFKIPLTTN